MTNSAPYRHAGVLAFRPVKPTADAKTLIGFGRDLYRESLGDVAQFHRDFGQRGQKFPLWIFACAARNRSFAVLLLKDDAAIGFVAMGDDPRRKGAGHIHHFYVTPEHRGQGYGGLLDDYARETLLDEGFRRASLNVTTRNKRAIRFYLAQGYVDIGGSKSGALRYMEVAL